MPKGYEPEIDELVEPIGDDSSSQRPATRKHSTQQPSKRMKINERLQGSGQSLLRLNDGGEDDQRGDHAPGSSFFKAEEEYREHVRQRNHAKDQVFREAMNLEIMRDEDSIKQKLFADPNIRFMQWVAGFCGIGQISKLMVGVKDTTDSKLFRDDVLGGQSRHLHYRDTADVEWNHGEKRISANGLYCLTPIFIAARDTAFSKIKSLRLDGRPLLPNDFSMNQMVLEDELNQLFARLTACIYRTLTLKNPTRYVSKDQSKRLVYDQRTVKHDLMHFFKHKYRSRASGHHVRTDCHADQNNRLLSDIYG